MHDLIKLTFVGDTMCKMTLFDSYKVDDDKYDFSPIFRDIKALFSESHFVGANLETPISYDNSNLTEERFCFNSPYEFAKAAHESGIDFFATANNHCLDRGVEGISSTCKSLDKLGVLHTGVFDSPQRKPLLTEVNGLRIGLLSYTYGTNAFSNHNYLSANEYWRVNLFQQQELTHKISRFILNHRYSKNKVWQYFFLLLKQLKYNNFDMPVYERRELSFYQRKQLKKDIKRIKKEKPDIIVFYMHIGGQYNSEANNYTKKMSHYLTDLGVNIVVGTHEHVVHGGDFSNIADQKVITYSLGNFDGVAGVYDSPFDKMAEYSIAWNVYVSNKEHCKIEKTTFNVLKTIKDDLVPGGIKTVPAYDLYVNETVDCVKERLRDDIIKIASIFSGNEEEMVSVEQEYSIHY